MNNFFFLPKELKSGNQNSCFFPLKDNCLSLKWMFLWIFKFNSVKVCRIIAKTITFLKINIDGFTKLKICSINIFHANKDRWNGDNLDLWTMYVLSICCRLYFYICKKQRHFVYRGKWSFTFPLIRDRDNGELMVWWLVSIQTRWNHAFIESLVLFLFFFPPRRTKYDRLLYWTGYVSFQKEIWYHGVYISQIESN